jgi:hypothetical protein
MTKYIERITQRIIMPEGTDIFDEGITRVEIDDEAAGEFIVIKQDYDDKENKIKIDFDEWPFVKKAVDKLIKEINHEKD